MRDVRSIEAEAYTRGVVGRVVGGVARRWPQHPAVIPLIVAPVAFAILVVGHQGILDRPFGSDDLRLYQWAQGEGPSTLFRAYAGYLVIAIRGAMLVVAAVPPPAAVMVGNALALACVAIVAGFLASDRMRDVFPDQRIRIVVALLLCVLPGASELLGSVAHIQWVLGVYLVAMLVATLPTSPVGRMGDALGILVAGLTGPIAWFLAPLYAIRAWRVPAFRWHFAWLLAASVLQVIVYRSAYRSPPGEVDPGLVPAVLAYRLLQVPFLGSHGPAFAWVLAGIVALALAAAVARVPRPYVLAATYIAVAFAVAGVLSANAPTERLMDPFRAQRYFYLGQIVFVGLIVFAIDRRRSWLAVPAALILTIGILADLRVLAIPV
jgi:hypothetical protein